jgi:hypothetical protein
LLLLGRFVFVPEKVGMIRIQLQPSRCFHAVNVLLLRQMHVTRYMDLSL